MSAEIELPAQIVKFIQDRKSMISRLQIEIEAVCKLAIGDIGGEWEINPDNTKLIRKGMNGDPK